MLDKLKEAVRSVSDLSKAMQFDPSKFDDPIAEQTEWTTLSQSSTNFKTHKLVTDDVNRAEFKATLGATLFSGIFMGIGLIAFIVWVNTVLQEGISFTFDSLGLLLFPVIFGGVGYYLFRRNRKPIVFDKLKNAFWRSNEEPDHHTDIRMLEDGAHLDDVHALQLLRKYVRRNNSSSSSSSSRRGYYVYELNLVLKDGTRRYVVSHGSGNSLMNDAKKLSEFLNVPVWSAV